MLTLISLPEGTQEVISYRTVEEALRRCNSKHHQDQEELVVTRAEDKVI